MSAPKALGTLIAQLKNRPISQEFFTAGVKILTLKIKPPLQKKAIQLGLLAALLVVLAIGLTAYRTMDDLLASNRWKSHTHQMIGQLEELNSAMAEAESSRRGFILTGSDKLLGPYTHGVRRLERQLEELRLLSGDNLEQQRRLDRLVPLVHGKLSNLEESIVRFRKNGYEAAAQAQITAGGKEIMDDIRSLVTEMKLVEQGLLQKRMADEEHHIENLAWAMIAGMLGSVAVILICFVLVRRETRQHRRAADALRQSEAVQRALMDALDESAFLLAADGTVLTLNETAARRFGKRADEILNSCVYDHFPADLATSRRKNIDRVLATGRPERFQDERQGHSFDVLVYPVAPDGGRVDKLAVFAFDISERLEAERRLRESSAELERSNREIRLMSQLTEMLQTCQSVQEACEVIVRFGGQLFPRDAGAVCLITASRNLVEAVAVWGETPRERVFAPDECWALRRGQGHLVRQVGDVHCGHVDDEVPFSLCAPMMAQSETLGVLHLLFDPAAGEAVEAKRQLALVMAEQVGLALANLKLREKLRDLSIRDPLTGLLNRRYMEESLERELHRARRRDLSLGVVMLDVDHFKRFNDTYGHDAGDAVLRDIGQFLKQSVRDSDIACRFGGEEFTLILPEASREAVLQRVEQLRVGVANMTLMHQGQPLGPVTISLGVATFPDDGETSESLLRGADRALYRAKREGRNRVCLATASAAPVQLQAG